MKIFISIDALIRGNI